jgi:hypothetical protein
VSDRQDIDPHIGSEQAEDNETFLGRWSRRKRTERVDGQVSAACAPQAVQEQAGSTADGRQSTLQRDLTDDDMPPLDSLDENSDYAAFMSPGISETLRRQALRKLFHLPGVHVPDGLDDYDEDFSRFAGLGDVVTHEMKRMLEREWKAANGAEQNRAGTAGETGLQDDGAAAKIQDAENSSDEREDSGTAQRG